MAKKKTASKNSAAAPAEKISASSASGADTSRETTAKKSTAKKVTKRRSTKHTDAWTALSATELEQHLLETPPTAILEAFEESYTADVVNVLLDLRKSVARRLFESLVSVRKRAMVSVVAMYYYKEYLMNPLPLEVGNDRTPNYYAILGIPRDADPQDIKMAHRLLVKAHDTENFSPPMRAAGLERVAEINDAFRHLQSDEKRRATDTTLPSMHYLYPRRDQSWLKAAQRILE